MHDVAIENIPTLCIWSMHIAQSSLTATPSFPSSFDTKTLTLSVKARGLIALVHLCPYRRSLPACLQAWPHRKHGVVHELTVFSSK